MDPKTINLLILALGLFSLVLFLWYFATDKEARKRWVGTLLSIMLVSAGIIFLKYKEMQYGIDLKGGVAYTVSVVGENGAAVPDASVEAAKDILERRLSPLGNKDVVITPIQGQAKLYVEVPGISPEEAEANRSIIEKTAKLEFRLVHPQSESLIAARPENDKVLEPGWVEVPNLSEVNKKPDPNDLAALKEYEVSKAEKAKKAEVFLAELEKNNDPDKDKKVKEERLREIFQKKQTIVVKSTSEMSGKSVKNAGPRIDTEKGGFMINVELDSDYGDKMMQLTGENRGQPLAIVVDGEVLSAPTIQSQFGADFVITGNFDQAEAENLGSMLMNPLENPLRIDQVSNTSSTYGEGLIKQGLLAGAIGLSATLLFMAIYYRLAGVIAVIGLGVNLLLLLAAMNVFEFTLTMPGVAGIILTLGIAIDANVLIYERMREEMATGKDLESSLDASYSKAFTAIFDSNLTSLITSVIMIVVATGAIRGFGVTLTIGILASLFTALMITRVAFRWLCRSGLKSLSFASLVKNRYIDFLSKRKIALTFSLVLCLASVAILAIKGKESLGHELRGGDEVTVTGATADKVQQAILGLKNKDGKDLTLTTQTVTPVGKADPEVKIRGGFETGMLVKEAINKAMPEVKVGEIQSVGPTVGGQMLTRSLIAIALGLLGIFIYLVLRYETPFAIGGIVAIFHDCLIAAGFCALFGKEIGMVLIGALLTIAGYSINDTIVIFDRIREQLKSSTGDNLQQVMNEAISATLSRTIITSGVTLLVVISMLFFGGATLADFSLAMLLGMVVGTYSTIFIASPIVYWWAQKRGLNLAAHIQEAELAKSSIGSGIEMEVNPNEVIAEEPVEPKSPTQP